jgi:hypothetical protein
MAINCNFAIGAAVDRDSAHKAEQWRPALEDGQMVCWELMSLGADGVITPGGGTDMPLPDPCHTESLRCCGADDTERMAALGRSRRSLIVNGQHGTDGADPLTRSSWAEFGGAPRQGTWTMPAGDQQATRADGPGAPHCKQSPPGLK